MAFTIYTELIAAEARRRGIGVRHVEGAPPDYAELTYKGHREFILQSMTDRIGAVKLRLLYHKPSALALLERYGHPIPRTLVTSEIDKAAALLEDVGRIVVKPVAASMGNGVTPNIKKKADLEAAFEHARAHTRGQGAVLVQEHVRGEDHRVLVVGKRRLFAVQRVPPFVTGDGKSTVAKLAAEWNEGVALSHHRIPLEKAAERALSRQGFTFEHVPPYGAEVRLGRLANAHRGGFAIDVTEVLCDAVVDMALTIAEELDVDVLGIDIMSEDIAATPGHIIELNPHAGIAVHHRPTIGTPRNPAAAIVDMLFPETRRVRR
jgi:cyanophycin synthetase